jgi:hypothetical protein
MHGKCRENVHGMTFSDQTHKKRGGDSSRRRCPATVTNARGVQKTDRFSYGCD